MNLNEILNNIELKVKIGIDYKVYIGLALAIFIPGVLLICASRL